MHPQTVRRVLADENTLDVAMLAEAVREAERLRTKRDKRHSKLNSAKAYVKWLSRQKEEAEFRQQVKKIWDKKKGT